MSYGIRTLRCFSIGRDYIVMTSLMGSIMKTEIKVELYYDWFQVYSPFLADC